MARTAAIAGWRGFAVVDAGEHAIRQIWRRLFALKRVAKFLVHVHTRPLLIKLSRSAAIDRRRWLFTVLIGMLSALAISVGSISS